MISAATLSEDGVYRYDLIRRWGSGRPCLWVCLNPSTADASLDDPTIRRVINFSKGWGFGAFTMVNLFGLRSPDPKALFKHPDPVGPDNLATIARHLPNAGQIVVAWGASKRPRGADAAVLDMLRPYRLWTFALGFTKHGDPRHPLYLKADTALVRVDPS